MANKYYITDYCIIENNKVMLNGETLFAASDIAFTDFAKQAYKSTRMDYAKFFKMDSLSKLSFLGAELILKKYPADGTNNTALLFANASSSLDTDVKHNDSIGNKENYFPSPAVFVYTLPNICMGEISIRHKLFTENSFFIFDCFNTEFFANYATILLDTNKADRVLCGWVELFKDEYRACLYMVDKTGNIEHTIENIQTLYTS